MTHRFAGSPCNSCPYRRDVKTRIWAREEFERLLGNDADPMRGSLYMCHRFIRDPEHGDICAGWFLDQKRRGFPSIQLRMHMIRGRYEPVVVSGGHPLYRTLRAMCRANGVRVRT